MSILGRSISKSVGTTIVVQAVSLALVIIVSRLLPPADIGAYVLAFAIATVLEPLRELQVRSYILVADEISPAALAPVRMLALVATAGTTILSLGIAWVLWASYVDPAAGNCMAILTLATIFRPFSQPAQAILQRGMRYGAIAGTRVGGTILGAILSLAMVYSGFGIESLAWGVVLQYAFEATAIAMVRPELRFGPISRHGMRKVFTFCAQLSGVQLLTRSIANVEPMLIGFFLGLSATAFYNRGNRLIRTVRTGVEEALLPIALAEFSRNKNDKELVGADFLRAVSRLTGVLWPGFAALGLLAEPTVLLMFGDQWKASVPVAQILSIGGIIYVLTAISQQAHASIGETALLLKRESWISPIRVIILLIAVQFSIVGVAIGMVILIALSTGVNIRMLRSSFGLSLGDIALAVRTSLAVTILTIGVLVIADHYLLHDLPHWQRLGLAGSIALPAWIASIVVTRHPLASFMMAIMRRRPAG